MSLTVIDMMDLARIDNGDPVELYQDDDIVFSGIVLNVVRSEPIPGMLEHSVSAVDNSALADKRLVAKVYENELAGDIAKDLIVGILGQEGVKEGFIQDGVRVKKAVFNYITCSEALNYLKNLTGYAWTIDAEKRLNFFDRSANQAPWQLGDNIQHARFMQTQSMDRYRNTQYIRGGRGRTAVQEHERPTPRPDGESRNFVLRFPVAQKPLIEVNHSGSGWAAVDPNDIGVNGLDRDKLWYFTFGSQIITQDTSQTALDAANDDAIRITYTGLRNLFVKIDDPLQISERAAAETGTSGIYEKLAKESSIDQAEQAIQFAQGLIETYGEIKDIISFETNQHGLKAGQLLLVNKPLYDINTDFLIESITIRPDGDQVRYSVKALDGAALGGWEEFFKELLKGQRDFVIAENEVIILLQSQAESTGYRSSVQIRTIEAIYPSDTLYPGVNLYPGILRNEVIIHD